MRNTFATLGLLIALSSYAQQVPKSLTASNGELIGFYEYKPTDYNTSTKYPVIIFLHGIGERGNGITDLPLVLGNGTPRSIQDGHTMRFYWNGKWETFLVLTPQLNSKYGWWPNFYVDEMINYATKNLSIDPNRIFLTGLSLGGGGVWSYAAGSPDNARKLAGIAVTCGTCQGVNWCNIANANLPTWAFHAADDGTVGAGCSSGAIQGIEACQPAVKPYLTIWPTGQHWIWGRVYNTGYEAQHPNIYEWFLGQNKSKAPNKRPVAHAGADQTISAITGIATLNASASTDADGNIQRYVWTKVSGPSFGVIAAQVSVGNTTLVTGLNYPGTYVYELRVIDDRADWAVDQVAITVVPQIIPDPIGNKNPVANAGADVTLTLPANSTTLHGSASDPDGSITTWAWTKVNGPSQFTITNSGSASATVSNLAEGTYTFRLTVADNAGAVSSDDMNVIVKYPEKYKIASAGSDIFLTLPANSTTLDGSASSDPGGPIRAYEWQKIAGPAQYSIANAKSAKTTLSNLVAGEYRFRLVVWDHLWVPVADSVTVTVKQGTTSPGKVVVDAGNDTTITLPSNSAKLNGSGCYDPGGAINQFQWSLESGPSQYTIASSKSATTTISNLVQGTYKLKLTMWDHNWVPGADYVTITVEPGANPSPAPSPPPPDRIAYAGPDIMITLPVNSTTLNGSGSYDPNGDIKAWQWMKISGPWQYTIGNARSATTPLTNLVQGIYQFKLVVWDHQWVPTADTVDVIVNAPWKTDPSRWANAGQDIFITLPANSTTLDGSASADPSGGSIKAWEWKKISGPSQYSIASPRLPVTAVNNLQEGYYAFQLTTWNNEWVPMADTVNVFVTSGSSSSLSVSNAEAVMSTRTRPFAETIMAEKLAVYPNPAKNMMQVQAASSETGRSGMSIYDLSGKKLQQVSFVKTGVLHQQMLNVTRLAPGIYFLEVTIGDKRRMITQFIKQ